MLGLDVADDGLDSGSALHLAPDRGGDASRLTADPDAEFVGMLVAAIALIDMDAAGLDKANQWLSRRMMENRARKKGRIIADLAGIEIARPQGTSRIAWSEIAEITALRQSAFIGDNLGLTIRGDDGTVVEIKEFDPAWQAVIDGVSRHLAGALPYAQWSLKTAFLEPSGRVQVFKR